MCVLPWVLFHATLFTPHGIRVSHEHSDVLEAALSHDIGHADGANQTWLFNAHRTNEAIDDTYDVIIIGAGLTGSAFAGRLAEVLGPDKRALLLEAGGASQSNILEMLGEKSGDPPADCTSWWTSLTGQCSPWRGWHQSGGTRWDVPGNYPVLPCWDNSCSHGWGRLPSYQCKILGGCGVSNGALMQQPSPNNFNSWPSGWQWDQLQPYYDDIEHRFSITGTPSSDGDHYLDDTGANVLRDALSGVGFHDHDMLQRPMSNTMGIPRVAALNGVRQSTASVMLPAYLRHPGFTLKLHAKVKEILFDNGRATGVRYHSGWRTRTAALKPGGRVVLAAGAFNTPRILMDSGVGPGMRINNQFVGRGISDHSITSVTYRFPSNSSIRHFNYESPNQQAIDQYINDKSGPLAQYGPTLAAFFKSEADTEGDFDVEVFVNPAEKDNEMKVYFILMKPDCSSANLTVYHSLFGGGVSMHGKVHLRCHSDRVKMNAAVKLVGDALRKVGAVHAQRFGDWPIVNHMNHWVGSCKLDSCVDATTLTVHGTDNVAVVDASILPSQIWGHPALSLKVVALKAADVVARQL